MSAARAPARSITLGTRDHARMRAFYVALGWPVGVDIEGDLTSFLLGGVVLALWPLELLAAEAAPEHRRRGRVVGASRSRATATRATRSTSRSRPRSPRAPP